MINVLIPIAGKSLFFPESEYPFPKPLIEIGNQTMIELVISNLSQLSDDIQFIFVLNSADCLKFHLDSTLNIITNHQCRIVRLDNETKGAACSALMTIDHIANEQPLVIANSDQLFLNAMPELLSELAQADAGVTTFESVHPRWSYVRLNENGNVMETAEKRPISRHAIAGLYYFRRGLDFVDAAMCMIQKNSSVNGNFYISPVLNELILRGKTVNAVPIPNGQYHTFYTPQKIQDYEAFIARRVAK